MEAHIGYVHLMGEKWRYKTPWGTPSQLDSTCLGVRQLQNALRMFFIAYGEMMFRMSTPPDR